jgi:DNA-binding MarR family transcriptional regulator
LEGQLTLLMRNIGLLSGSTPGMDRSSYLLLRTLDNSGPVSIKTLASRLGLTGSTVTRQVSMIRSAGLVWCVENPADRRSRIVSLCPYGRKQMAVERARRRDVIRTVTAGWTEDDRGQLARLLDKLNRSLWQLDD